MNDSKVAIPLQRFLLNEQRPEAWKGLGLYLFRDEGVVFYAGQSHLAFSRVGIILWAGFHGHSIIGRNTSGCRLAQLCQNIPATTLF